MSKVNLNTIKPWITTRVNQLLGIDDDVVVEFVFNLLENTQFPDPKDMQMNLTGFLNGKNTRIFMQELWDLLASAQENIGGIPSIFLEQKKEVIRQNKVGLFFPVTSLHQDLPFNGKTEVMFAAYDYARAGMYYAGIRNNLVYVRMSICVPYPIQDRMNFSRFSKRLE